MQTPTPTGGRFRELRIYKDKIPPEEVKFARYVREAGGLGDVVRLLALGQGMRLKYKNARLHFYGPAYLESLIAPRSDAFDVYYSFTNGLRPRDVPLDEECFPHLDVGIDYDVSLCGWCPPYLHEPNTRGVCCQDRTELWCRVGGVPFTRPKLRLLDRDKQIRDYYKEKHKVMVGIQPGATCRSREWPYAYWNKLCHLLAEEGVHVVLFDLCYRWLKEIDLSNVETSINKPWPETLGKLSACDLVISPDSGFFHLAGALELKSIGLFGCTSGQIISRPWNLQTRTGNYLQVSHSEIDFDLLPKTSGCNRPCQPRCYMRWERGWDSDRYRKEQRFCSLLEQISVHRVFSEVMKLLNC